MRLMVTNFTTGEVKVFTEDIPDEMVTFMRKAVLDFLGNCNEAYIPVPGKKSLHLTEDSPELLWWLGAAFLYMGCIESGDWEDILEIEIVE